MAPGLALGLIALSLVPLTGWAGQVSLCQMTFAGLGAFATVKFAADGAAIGLLAAVLVAAPVGALVALPALRLRGLYLALATLAFAVLMDNVFFIRADVFGNLGAVRVERLEIAGLSFAGEQAYFVLLASVFGPWRPACSRCAGDRSVDGCPPPRQPAGLHDDGARHHRHQAAGVRAVLGHRRAGRGAVGGLAPDGARPATTRCSPACRSCSWPCSAASQGSSGALVGGLVLAGFPVLADDVSFLEGLAILGPG